MKLKLKNKFRLKLNILICIVLLLFLVAGCGQNSATGPSDKAGQNGRSNWPRALTIGSSPIGGNYYVLATALGEKASKAMNITVTPEATTGSSQNISLIQQGEMELSFGTSHSLYEAVHGVGEFEKIGKAQITLLWNAYPVPFLTVTRSESGIKTYSDLKSKKYMADLTGSPTSKLLVTELLGQHGLTRKDVNVLPFSAKEEGITGMTEKTIDAFVLGSASKPTGAFLQIQDAIDAHYLPLGEKEAKNIIKKYPFFSETIIPANNYENQKEPLRALAWNTVFLAGKDLPEDLVYEFMKSTWDNMDSLVAMSPIFKEWSLQNAVKDPVAPFHPGAIKYYKEKGVWTAELEEKQQELKKELGWE